MLHFFSHDVFTSGDLREFRGQDEVTLCQQRILSCPSEIQGVRVAMGRHEQLPPRAVTSNCRHGPSRAIPLRTCRRLRGAEEKRPTWMIVPLSVWIEDRTRRQPRGVRSQPWGAASGDQGTRGSVLSRQSGGKSPRQRVCSGSAKNSLE